MFPASFDYYRPETVAAAQRRLADHDDADARLLAGGQGLVPSMKLGEESPDVLVDVSGVDALAGVTVADDRATVGALTTHAEVLAHDGLAATTPVLVETARHTADRQVRNRGTLGGNLAEADPAADPPAGVLAAGGTLQVRRPDGERAVPATEFFAGGGGTALGERDVLAAVSVPAHDAAGYARKTHPATGYAAVGVAAALDLADGAIGEAGVAATGLVDPARRLPSVEDAVEGRPPTAVDAAEVASVATDDVEDAALVGDEHVSASFRRELLPTYVERALAAALEDLAPTAQDGGDGA